MADDPERKPAAQGNFARIPFPVFLYALYKRDATGELRIHRSTDLTTIFLRDGFPVFVLANQVTDPLGRILLELGMINEAQFNLSLEKLARGAGLQGQILVEMGAISPEQLATGLQVQLRRKLNRLFYLEDAEFEFYAGDHTHGEFHAHPLQIIHHGIRNACSRERLDTELAVLSGRAVKLPASFEPYKPIYDFAAEEQPVVDLLMRGFWRLEDLVAAAPLGEIEVKMMVYTLLLTEVLDVRPAEEVELEPRRQPAAAPAGRAPDRPAAPPTALDPDKADRRKQILEKHAALQGKDYFQILELPRTAPVESARKAYHHLARIFHPDRFSDPTFADLQPQIEEVFAKIAEASATLSDPLKRQDYLELLTRGIGQADATKLMEAELQFQKGSVLLKRGDFAGALEALKEACEANRKEGEYESAYAWAKFMAAGGPSAPPEVRKEVLRHLASALEAQQGKADRTHYYLGVVFRADGKEETALSHFKQAARQNPRNIEAAREVRLSQMRREKGSEGKGGLFSRKKK